MLCEVAESSSFANTAQARLLLLAGVERPTKLTYEAPKEKGHGSPENWKSHAKMPA